MKKPIINREMIKTCFESKFLNMYDIQHAPGRHYYNATRKKLDNPVCLLSEEEFKTMLPDAINAVVILKIKGEEPKLYFNREFRYPVGQFVLNPPAGIIDPKDKETSSPLITATKREIYEETGIKVKDSDRIFVANPGVFSSPGLTDESNAIVCAVIDLEDEASLNHESAEDTECFDGYLLLTKEEAVKMIKSGRDLEGKFIPAYAYICLLYFVSDMWME